MARRDFRRGAVAIRKARETTWIGFQPANFTIATASTAQLAFSLNAAALALRPMTIVRTRFMIFMRSDQAAALEQQSAAVGLAVVSDQSVGVGVTAVPTPITDMPSAMWFVHQLIFGDESELTDRTKSKRVIEIDSKVMRKVEVGQDIIVVVETSATSSGAIIQIGGRMLIKNN